MILTDPHNLLFRSRKYPQHQHPSHPGGCCLFVPEGVAMIGGAHMNNPRYKNGALRRKNRARLKAQGLPCYLCGRPIHYDEPSDHDHPWSFVIDEAIPVSRWKEFGYPSPEAVANDYTNLRAAHYICNLQKSNRTPGEVKSKQNIKMKTQNVKVSNW